MPNEIKEIKAQIKDMERHIKLLKEHSKDTSWHEDLLTSWKRVLKKLQKQSCKATESPTGAKKRQINGKIPRKEKQC